MIAIRNIFKKLGRFPIPPLYIAIIAGIIWLEYTLETTNAFSGSQWAHLITESVSTIIAFCIGVLALTRYYASKHTTILLLGVGFIGSGLLDGFHSLASSNALYELFPSPPQALIPWSWNASRTFLALLLFFSLIARSYEKKHGETKPISDDFVYTVAFILLVSCLAILALLPLGRAYFPEYILGRPQELIAGALFGITLIWYYRSKEWKNGQLEFWIVASLIFGVASQCLFMSRSFTLYDDMYGAAHILKILSYLCVFAGLQVDMYTTWRSEIHLSEALHIYTGELENRVKERTTDLSQAIEALEASNHELKQFAYIASHDLQTPLRSVAGYIKLLNGSALENLDQDERLWISKISDCIERMSKLIRDQLNYSKIDSSTVSFKDVNFQIVCNDAIESLAPAIEDKQAEINCTGMPLIHGDYSQLLQLMENLIGNAVKYCDAEIPRVSISAEHYDDDWLISVKDNGIGIDPKQHQKVFEIFQRLHTQKKYPGTGIGLAICKRVVERHHGTIWLETNENGGTTFFFTLPTIRL